MPDEVILHVSAIVSKLVCREIVLSRMEYYHFCEDGADESTSAAILDEMGQELSVDHESITQIEWKQVKERTMPEPSRFQTHRDKIIVDLRAAIAPNGPTTDQVNTVAKLLGAIPEDWWHLLPLPECETWTSDDDGSIGPTISFCSGRARLRIDIGNGRVYFSESGLEV